MARRLGEEVLMTPYYPEPSRLSGNRKLTEVDKKGYECCRRALVLVIFDGRMNHHRRTLVVHRYDILSSIMSRCSIFNAGTGF